MEREDTYKGEGAIVVPVEYNNASVQACRYAAKISAKSGNDIVIYHSYYSPAFDLIELSGGLTTQHQLRADVSKQLYESETEELDAFVEGLYNYKEFSLIQHDKIHKKLDAGIAKDEIVSYSEKTKPYIVVMGSRSSDIKSSSILGSTAEAVITNLHVPVLVIPEDYKFIGFAKLDKIVYLTDFDESDFMSIKKLMSFAELFNMSIHCIHIGDSSDKWELLKMDGLKEYFHKIYGKDTVLCHIINQETNLVQAINYYIKEMNINLISLTHKKRKILEKIFRPSTTKKLFHHTNIPLLVFHD